MADLSTGRGSPPQHLLEAATLADLLRARASLTPDRPAYLFLTDGETEAASLTWGELDRLARSHAAVLRRNAAAGDRALLLYPPGLDFIVAFFACLYARVVAVPAYPPRPRRDQPRLRAIVQDAEPKVVLTTQSLLAGSDEILKREPSLQAPRWLALDLETGLAGAVPGETPEEHPEPGDPAFLQYTSGSTALPKGVVVTHGGLLHNERMIGEAFGTDENAVVVGWLPLYHDMGLIGNVLQPLYCGGRCVLMAPAAFLQRPRRWLEAISRYRGTTSGGPNFAYELCLQKIGPEAREGLDLSHWTVAYNGAEPVRADTLDRFAAAFAGCGFSRQAFYPCYGLAEATLFVTGGRPGEGARVAAVDPAALARQEALPAVNGEDGEGGAAPAVRLVSSGHPWAGQEVLIVDPESRSRCPPGRVGEIWVSGPSVAPAYWGRPEVSETELHARLADGSGSFLRTGDLGFVQDGELYVTGRRKDLIILRGRNHYPQDLELTAERAHSALRPGGGAAFQAEVDGDERLIVVFEVERHSLSTLSTVQGLEAEEVAAAVRRSLAEENEVQLYELVLIRPASLPRTSSGKVQRHRCRELYLSGGLAVVGRSALGGPGERAALRDEAEGWAEEAVPVAETDADPVADFLHAALARAVRLDPARIDRGLPMSSFGLDSLAAVELSHAAEMEFGVALPVAELLSGWSVAEAAREVAALAAAAGNTTAALPRETPAAGIASGMAGPAEAPLSFGQQALWVLHGLAPANAAYTIAGAARLVEDSAPLDVAALARAFHTLVERHPALRTTYANGPQGPVQRFHPPAEAGAVWSQEDASGSSRDELARRIREAAWRPFDLEHGPVVRAVLFAGGPGGSVLVLTVHHIAADFWSLAVLLRELGELYAAAQTSKTGANLPAPALHYADLVARQRAVRAAGGYDAMLAVARRQLAGAPPLDLPLDRPRPDLQTFRGALRGSRLGHESAAAAAALARRSEATLFMVLLAAFEALLSRHGGQEDFLVGTPTTGRPSHDLSGVVGYLVNPAPIRADLAGDPDVLTLLARARRAALDALARQDLPFPLLAEGLGEARDPSRPAVFQAMLVLQRSPVPELENLAAFALDEEGARVRTGAAGGTGGMGLILESVALERPGAQLDLTLFAAEMGGDLAAAFEWNLDLFDASTIERMLGHFAHLLSAMTRHPERRLSELEMLAPAETQQILCEWNATAAPQSAACLHELIEAQVERTPEAPAVSCNDETLTYRELNTRANLLARHLERMGVGPDVLVGLCLERSNDLVTALVATLKAGGAFVPIDPSYPAERIAYMIEDSRVAVALTEERFAPLLRASAGATRTTRTFLLDAERERWSSGPDPGNRGGGRSPDQLAYVLYTSGSTGRPKGAMNSHRGIVNRLQWMQETFPLQAADRVLQKTPTSFDVSVWELFWPLVGGACLVMARPGGHLDPPYLRDEIARSRITLVHFVPSMLQVFLEQPGLEACAGLRRVFLSGEAVGRDLANRFQASLGRLGHPDPIELHNLYGPAEAAVEVTWWPCRDDGDTRPVPIGRPLDNVRIHVLDRHLRPVPVGCAGELHIGGVQVARGYLGRPELTAERFCPDPFSSEPGGRLYRTGDLVRHRAGGEIEFLGRIDHQIKLGGVRIELGEIEHALAGHAAVREAVVLARSKAGKIRLVAYVVPAADGSPDIAALREHLLGKLPATMIPSSWVFLPSLPLSPSGKVDRKALPEPVEETVASSGVQPVTDAEKALVAIWSEVLGRTDIGIHDNFFSLGGDSIIGIQVLSRAAQVGLKLTPRQIFRHPTIAELAAAAEPVTVEMAATAEPEPATDFSESGLSELDLQKLMSKLMQKEQGWGG